MKKAILFAAALAALMTAVSSCEPNYKENLQVQVYVDYQLPDSSQTRVDSIFFAYGDELLKMGFVQSYAANIYTITEVKKKARDLVKSAGELADMKVKNRTADGTWGFVGTHVCELRLYNYAVSDSSEVVFCSGDYGHR